MKKLLMVFLISGSAFANDFYAQPRGYQNSYPSPYQYQQPVYQNPSNYERQNNPYAGSYGAQNYGNEYGQPKRAYKKSWGEE